MNKKEIVKHFYEVIVSSNLLEELYKYVSEDCVLISGDRKIPLGLEGMKEHLVAVKQTYPDYTMRILRQYEDGDYIISEFVMEGTHEGEWIGIKPTHKRLSFTGVDIDKVIDGKIVEHGGAVNTYVLHVDLSPVQELVSLQRRCSNNLNQVAIQANTYGGIYPEEIKALQRDYEKLWRPLSDLLEKLSAIVRL